MQARTQVGPGGMQFHAATCAAGEIWPGARTRGSRPPDRRRSAVEVRARQERDSTVKYRCVQPIRGCNGVHGSWSMPAHIVPAFFAHTDTGQGALKRVTRLGHADSLARKAHPQPQVCLRAGSGKVRWHTRLRTADGARACRGLERQRPALADAVRCAQHEPETHHGQTLATTGRRLREQARRCTALAGGHQRASARYAVREVVLDVHEGTAPARVRKDSQGRLQIGLVSAL
jgi:hypothetical protein